ncbi:TPA: hypothetical protein PTV74_003149 [Clostridium botulinum]|nr:hypothetical protein [Clostridium botulinum]HDK7206304.1 hypothetical protein [Clostridium botulinum]HDK7210040.1 hypothetical protein [Clostridium botulinum]HDK7265489.1 hypothetical protein [Clostridium botulinum]HDK7269337.1 hypothetical protein [Clostridium botulinum]
MNYISPEEFLKQSEEVQKILVEYITPKEGDLLFYEDELYMNELDNHYYIMTIGKNDCLYMKQLGKTQVIPLLQIHHLIQFIEEKTKGKLEISFHYSSYRIWSHELDNNFICTGKYYFFDKLGKNLLQALWQVACKIAQEEADNQKQNIISTNKQGLPVIKGGGKTMREMYNEEYR